MKVRRSRKAATKIRKWLVVSAPSMMFICFISISWQIAMQQKPLYDATYNLMKGILLGSICCSADLCFIDLEEKKDEAFLVKRQGVAGRGIKVKWVVALL